jgi:hypothetical protein
MSLLAQKGATIYLYSADGNTSGSPWVMPLPKENSPFVET